ncbi:MAG: rane protein, partial [Proteobacteria bacterium]|nr:rane protein [Pseudomonadota bacterium]
MIVRRGAAMARQLAEAYLLLVIYASLHPLSGWSATGAPLFEFLWAPWPRYYTVLDLILNVCAYLPLGLLLVPALRPRLKPGAAVVAAVAIGAALSLTLETVQNFLPSRVPSNLDLATNV